MKLLRKLWRWLRPGDVLYPPKEEIFKAVQDKTEQARQEVIEQFIRSAVDIKPGEKVEVKDNIAIVRAAKSKERLRQNAKQLQHYKKIWRQTDRQMPWKEFRAEINKMNNFGGAFHEVYGMMMDRQIERAECFDRIYRSTKNRDLAANVAKSIDRC